MSKIEARNNFVIIRAERDMNKSGIVLLKTEQYDEKDAWLKEAPLMIISVGIEVKNIKVGDRVILGATRAARYDYLAKMLDKGKENDVTYFAAKEEDIVAVLKD